MYSSRNSKKYIDTSMLDDTNLWDTRCPSCGEIITYCTEENTFYCEVMNYMLITCLSCELSFRLKLIKGMYSVVIEKGIKAS